MNTLINAREVCIEADPDVMYLFLYKHANKDGKYCLDTLSVYKDRIQKLFDDYLDGKLDFEEVKKLLEEMADNYDLIYDKCKYADFDIWLNNCSR